MERVNSLWKKVSIISKIFDNVSNKIASTWEYLCKTEKKNKELWNMKVNELN